MSTMQEEEEEDIDTGRGEPEATHAEEAAIPPPPPPLYPQFTHEMGGSSSSVTYVPLNPTFLQSFSNLQIEVSRLGIHWHASGHRLPIRAHGLH